VFNVAGGSQQRFTEFGPAGRAGRIGSPLATRVPSLINSPGITGLDGVAVAAPYFNENMPLRNGIPLAVRLEDGTDHIIQSPVINTVAGAMAIQEVIENTDWVMQSSNPVAYAPHLRKDPLAGVPAKSVIIQFAKGDQTVTNPATTALLRAGDLADRATLYRHDLAFAEDPALPKSPHTFLNPQAFMTSVDPLYAEIARGAQEQIAVFFASDGQEIIHPAPARFFETPIQGPLPEDLNFIPDKPPAGLASSLPGAVVGPSSQVLSGTFARVIPVLSPLAGTVRRLSPLDLAAVVDLISSSQAAPVLAVAGSTLPPALPAPEQPRTAAVPAPVPQGEPPPLAPASPQRAAHGAPLLLLDRLFAGLDSGLPFEGFADDVTTPM
jgi:hypothetical protein